MIQQEQFKRAGKDFIAHFGTDPATGKFYIYFEALQVDGDSGQPYTVAFEEVIIRMTHEGDGKSYVSGIETKASQQHLTNKGQAIEQFKVLENMFSNKRDLTDFISGFSAPIIRFMMNGIVRAMRFFGRNNYQPLFDAAGARIPDTAYNTAVEGPGNYSTHNADGTAVSGIAEENMDVTQWRA